jgi:hypothetical protein
MSSRAIPQLVIWVAKPDLRDLAEKFTAGNPNARDAAFTASLSPLAVTTFRDPDPGA